MIPARWCKVFYSLLLGILTGLLSACARPTAPSATAADEQVEPPPVVKEAVVKPKPSVPLVTAARAQVGVTLSYDPSYVGLTYPGGDVPRGRGVCTDVVIRALRDAHKFDLQKAVHEDMSASFSAYPQHWDLRKPDKNIDHRRVPNLQCFFKRKGYARPVTQKKKDYLPGDIVTCRVGNRPHIVIVSDKKEADGTPWIIHNIGGGVREEATLFRFPLCGHYRYVPAP